MHGGMMEFDLSNDLIAEMKFFQYRILGSHMFTWTNLPPGLEGERLELMLMDRGSVAFFNTAQGPFILPYTSTGHMNVYGDLISIRPVPINGDQLIPLDTVPRILYDNSVRSTFSHYLLEFSRRLAKIQTTISIMERQARAPSIITVNEENKASLLRLQSKIDEGYPFVVVDESMNVDAMKLFNTGFNPALFDAMWNDYNKVEGEIYSLLGTMFNVEQNKAAGVGPAETIINYSQTFALANSRLHQRQRWCDKINKEFGIGIACEKANDYQEIIEEMMHSRARDPSEMASNAKDIQAQEEAAR